MNRKIIHIDCDCFYAAIEMRDNPTLIHRPLAVGGDPGRRGVISTCNYIARTYGIHSAMASAYAKRLCPDLIILPHRIHHYKDVSQQIHRIFQQYTDRIEPLSLDEAYLDVTHQTHFQSSATRMAEAIRKQVRRQVGITVSAGVAPNKFLAKIASDWKKPDGCFVITPPEVTDFLTQLPIEKLHGVGKVTARRLHSMGIRTCHDIRNQDHFSFIEKNGGFGEYLYQLAHGIDNRPVQARSERKSISVEHTYETDINDVGHCQKELDQLKQELERRIEKAQNKQTISKAFVKLKFSDFSVTTAECLAHQPSLTLFQTLCKQAYDRKSLPVRLLGVGVRLSSNSNTFFQQAFDF